MHRTSRRVGEIHAADADPPSDAILWQRKRCDSEKKKKRLLFSNFSRAASPHAKATPSKRGLAQSVPFLDLTNKPISNSLDPLLSLIKKPKHLHDASITTALDDVVDIDPYEEYEDDVVDELASEDSVDDQAEKPKVPKNGKSNHSSDLPYVTTTYFTDSGKKHFVVFGLVAPRCAVIAPNVTVTDRMVTIEVPSLVYAASDGVSIVDRVKQYANLSDEKAQEVTTNLMKAVQEIKPWRYELTAPFQLDPNDVHTFIKAFRIGSTVSQNKHDVIVVDVGEYTLKTTNNIDYIIDF